MCLLKKAMVIMTLASGFFSGTALALVQKINSEYSVESSRERFSLREEGLAKRVRKKTFLLQHRMEELARFGVMGLAWRREFPDYSATVLRDQDGREYILDPSGEKGAEDFGNLSLGFKNQDFSLEASAEKNLSPSPYPRKGLGFKGGKTFFHQRSVFTAEFSFREQGRPVSYFLDERFQERERPSRIKQEKWQIGAEHILNERLKGALYLQTGILREERPRNYGGGLKMSYAFSDQFYGKLAFSHIEEDRQRPLPNELGYLTFNQVGSEVLYEPFYDFLVGASYYLNVEKEDDPRTKKVGRSASDEYGLGLSYQWGGGRMTTTLKAAHVRTNEASQSYHVTGGLQWTL